MPKIKSPILLLSAPPGSGKDFTALALCAHFNTMVFSHVETVRRANLVAFGLDEMGYTVEKLQERKNERLRVLGGRTWRETVIQTSEVYHLAYGFGFWADVTARKIRALDNELMNQSAAPHLYVITDMSGPDQVEVYEKAFPDRAIIVRLHRQDKTFGKYDGFKKAYGANTGLDSRNWCFSDVLPSFDINNYGDTDAPLLSDLVYHLRQHCEMQKLAITRNSASVGYWLINQTVAFPVEESTVPFSKPYQVYAPPISHSGKTVAQRFAEMEPEEQKHVRKHIAEVGAEIPGITKGSLFVIGGTTTGGDIEKREAALPAQNYTDIEKRDLVRMGTDSKPYYPTDAERASAKPQNPKSREKP